MAVAKAPGSCGINKPLNRDWAFQIKPKGAPASEWMFVPGLDSVSVMVETNTVDSSDIDSQGWESVTKTSRKFTIATKGNLAIPHDGTELHPAHQLLRDVGRALGADGELDVRTWRTDGTVEGYETTATAIYNEPEGDRNALRAFTSNFQSVCVPSEILPVQEGEEQLASKPMSEKAAKVTKTMTLPADRSGGTFTITVGSETTSEIKHNATAKDIKAALSALAGVTDAEVTGSGNSFKLVYKGAASISGTATKLTGGSAASTGIRFA